MGWADESALYADALESARELEALGAPGPEEWESYVIDMDAGTLDITTIDGQTFGWEGVVDLDNPDDYDWIWAMWDWLAENYPDVDRETKYSEA